MNNEDIKVLEEYVEEFNENKKKYKMVYSTGFGKYWTDFVQAIENLIKGYKELEEKQLKKSGIYEIGIDLDDDYIPKSKVRELQNKYKNKIEKLESKKIWNEPVDTINKNRYTNYYNAYEEILQEGDK